ncbi:Dam family site-specific DNA-(adenine-N6)-methyltransferase [Enterobacter ludwigii]|uniref:Dam family site-specific DNA-(adenine-N6)-methyltransferase n=1 Tax=Enterobacter ludwigii TaxID=299767 RepID=UPI001E4403F8|nr:Dam family site-specific DNA-(adenine-N6)-methyltransferase [Enterobacter ludwigii]MCE2009160.1 Dam family site-specific DNA-(adenine-N6)-methyltransferase [Enterobacter ludwigii]
MKYGSVCSGIEAASIAWEPLGWKPAWFSEIEPFPAAVLANHWPEVTNLGDMTKIAEAVRAGNVEAPDILVGGTPCQAFSIGGLRKGLDDPRGQLTLSYVETADAIDSKRQSEGKQKSIFVWENVPGAFSSKDNAFGCFLAGMAGENEAFEPGPRPASGSNSKFWRWDKETNKHIPVWSKRGAVIGRQRRVAWRTFDAQYFGLAQRRPRILLIATARTDIDPGQILFEPESLCRVNPPTKQTPVPVCLTARGAGSLDDRETYVVTPERRIRHLMPVENERQMGFPDNHTMVPWRGKASADCPDGPRYKAIGNSMAVPVMRWIGERIAAALPVEKPAPRTWQRPFLKWAGGKYSLLPELERLIPAGKRLIEPFVGGGSVFLNSEKHESFLLADVNADLINLYQMLEVDHIRVCSHAKILFERANSEEGYKELREEFNNQRMGAPERAAAFLFLNRHCFNGLIRYNRDWFFNVGWGKYEAPYFPEIEIKAFKLKSHKCVFLNSGYRRTLALAGEGDVIYCDPPYEPLPGTSGFTNYAAGGFSWDDQISLAENCVAAHQRGAKVLISNSTAPRVLELYQQHGFNLHHVDARRAISSKGSTRETAKDIVATLGV